MITKKYYIMFDSYDINMSSWININAAQYWHQMKEFDKVIESTKDNEEIGTAVKHSTKIERENEVRYFDYIMLGPATVTLCRTECKPGFHYSKKGQ